MNGKIIKWASGTPDKQSFKYEVGKNGVIAITDISIDIDGSWERGYRVELDNNTFVEIWNIPGIVYFKKE